jgi:membrane-associated phospholipid phosphatase
VTTSAVTPQVPAPDTGLSARVDRATQRALQAASLQRDELARSTAIAFNWWGGPGVIWVAAVLWLGARALRRPRLAELGLRASESIAVSSAISGIVKGLAGRSRPFLTPGEPWHWDFAHGWTDARYFSMPSGHTTATFAFAAAVSMVAARWPRLAQVGVTVAVFSSALLVAFARMYLDQHWATDVLAGALLGMGIGIALATWHARHPGSAFDRALLGSAVRAPR